MPTRSFRHASIYRDIERRKFLDRFRSNAVRQLHYASDVYSGSLP